MFAGEKISNSNIFHQKLLFSNKGVYIVKLFRIKRNCKETVQWGKKQKYIILGFKKIFLFILYYRVYRSIIYFYFF